VCKIIIGINDSTASYYEKIAAAGKVLSNAKNFLPPDATILYRPCSANGRMALFANNFLRLNGGGK
jgi:hypothetical protein